MALYKENKEFRILSAIGIILVVAGHLGYDVFDIGGLFPYYSFHVFIFLFVSGYFYKEEAEDRIVSYIWGKFVSLMVPYFLWNLFYGVVAALLHQVGFSIGESLSFKTLLLSPFIDGHQFMYHFPAWFVPVLFLLEVINVLMRKVFSLLRLNHEWLIFGLCLLAGILTVYFAIGGHVWGWYKIPGRLLFLFPGFQMGRIYREKLEWHDRMEDGPYLLLVMGIQMLITIFCGGLAFSAVWVTSFANGPILSDRDDGDCFLAADSEDHQYDSLFIPEAGLYRPSYLCGHDAPYGLLYAGEGILLPDEPMDAFLRRV